MPILWLGNAACERILPDPEGKPARVRWLCRWQDRVEAIEALLGHEWRMPAEHPDHTGLRCTEVRVDGEGLQLNGASVPQFLHAIITATYRPAQEPSSNIPPPAGSARTPVSDTALP